MLLVILLLVLNVSMLMLHRNKKIKVFGKTFNRVFLVLLIISLLLLGSYDFTNSNCLIVIIGSIYPMYIAGKEIKDIYIGENTEDYNV